jgi:hypothetical protein
MFKLTQILKKIIIESKKYEMDSELYFQLSSLAYHIFSYKKKKVNKQILVDKILFKTEDGTQGMVKIFLSPNLPAIAEMSTIPFESRDPMDFVMKLNPKKIKSVKNLFLTIYHEMMHAIDPTQSTQMSVKHSIDYDPSKDESYWGHPIEFFAITNEFLEALDLEIDLRISQLKNSNNKKLILKSLDNILDYFTKDEKLSMLSLDIIEKMGDDASFDSKISEIISKMTYPFPRVSEFMKKPEDPYFLYYVELIKKYNPEIWKKFLEMLQNHIFEIKKRTI